MADGLPSRGEPLALLYETAPMRRNPPPWVWCIVVLYGLVLLALAFVPLWAWSTGDQSLIVTAAITVAVLIASWAALLLIPINVMNRRPVRRSSLWLPLLASGLLAGILALGAACALAEWWLGSDSVEEPAALIIAAISWFLWTLVFWLISRARSPQHIGMRLHRWLLAGSVLELLIAVPTHVICRRREECCAGVMTGFGIACGIAVMLLAFGPSVALLYFKRARDIAPKRSTPMAEP